MNLEDVSTADLLQEIARRHQAVVFAADRPSETNRNHTWTIVRRAGNINQCRGLAHRLVDEVVKEMDSASLQEGYDNGGDQAQEGS